MRCRRERACRCKRRGQSNPRGKAWPSMHPASVQRLVRMPCRSTHARIRIQRRRSLQVDRRRAMSSRAGMRRLGGSWAPRTPAGTRTHLLGGMSQRRCNRRGKRRRHLRFEQPRSSRARWSRRRRGSGQTHKNRIRSTHLGSRLRRRTLHHANQPHTGIEPRHACRGCMRHAWSSEGDKKRC